MVVIGVVFDASVFPFADGVATGGCVICCNASWVEYPICSRSSKVLRSSGVSFEGVFMVKSIGGGCELEVVSCFELV